MDRVADELFPRFRGRMRSLGGAGRPAKARRQDFALEVMEPRVLLSADLTFATTTTHDVTVLFDAPLNTLKIVNTATSAVLKSQALADTAAVRITGSTSADNITVDLTAPFDAPVFFTDPSTVDADSLSVAGQGLHWTLTGADAGHADGAAD